MGGNVTIPHSVIIFLLFLVHFVMMLAIMYQQLDMNPFLFFLTYTFLLCTTWPS
jgi:hypothetical protein